MGIRTRISIINTRIHHWNVPFKCCLLEDGSPCWAYRAGVPMYPVFSSAVSMWKASKAQSAVERSESELALLSHVKGTGLRQWSDLTLRK